MTYAILGLVTILLCLTSVSAENNILELPKSPWKSCRFLFNEIQLDLNPDIGQYIELSIYCEDVPKKTTLKELTKFKLLVLNSQSQIILMCQTSMNFRSRETRSAFFVFGSRPKHVDETNYFSFQDCQYWLDFKERTELYIPIGTDTPVGIAIIYNTRHNHFLELEMLKVDEKYTPKQLTENQKYRLREGLQDFYTITSSSPFVTCDSFKYFVEPYLRDTIATSIRDWHTEPEYPDYSISRCSNGISYPFLTKYMILSTPTPGFDNDCQNQIRVENILPRLPVPLAIPNMNDENNQCYIVNNINNVDFELNQIMERDAYQEHLNVAMEEIVSTQEVLDNENEENTEELNEFTLDITEINNPVGSKFIWDNCDKFPRSWKTLLMQSRCGDSKSNLPRVDVQKHIIDTKACYWYEYLEHSENGRCKLCHALLKQRVLHERESLITGIMQTEGYMKKTGRGCRDINKNMIRNHAASAIHKVAVQYFQNYDMGLRGKALKLAMITPGTPYHQFYASTENMILLVHSAVRMRLSPYNYRILTDTVTFFGVDLGVLYNNPPGMTLILKFISEKYHDKLVHHILYNNPEFSISLDSSKNVAGIETLSIIFHTADSQDRQKSYFYELLELQGQSGVEMCDAFWRSIEKDGLQRKVRQNMISYVSDGASNMVQTFTQRLIERVGHQNFIHLHCMAHRLELAAKTTLYELPQVLHMKKVINKLRYLFGTSSPTRNKVMHDTRNQLNQKRKPEEKERHFSLHRIIDVRWVSSKNKAMFSILQHWETIVTALQKIIKEKNLPADDLYKGMTTSSVLDAMLDPIFLTNLAFMSDFTENLIEFSKDLQRRGSTLISKQSLQEKLTTYAEQSKFVNGPLLKKLLSNAEVYQPQVCPLPNVGPAGQTRADLTGNTNNPIESEELDSYEVRDEMPMEVDGNDDIEMNLNDFENHFPHLQLFGIPLKKNTATAVSSLFYKRENIINSFLSRFDFYFGSSSEDLLRPTLDKFYIMDPHLFPACGAARNYGENEIHDIVTKLNWNFNANTLATEFNLLVGTLTCHNDFTQYKSKYPEDFWNYFLSLKDDEILWSGDIKKFVLRILAIPASSSENERIFSVMNSVQTSRKFRMNVKTVNAVVNILMNGHSALERVDSFNWARDFVKLHVRSNDPHRASSGDKYAEEDFFLSIFDADED